MGQRQLEAVFAELYQPLLLYAISLTKNQADAEDLVQEAFYRFLARFDQVATDYYKAWLIKVVKNLFIDRQRKKQAILLEDEQFQLLPATDLTPLEITLKQAEHRQLYQALAKVKAPYQEVLFYFYFMQMTIKEIASSLHFTPGQTKTILSRGRIMLKKELEKNG